MITAVFERPSERMSFLVNRYLFLKSGSDDEPYTDKFIPDGYAGLVFKYFGDVKIVE